MVTSEMVLAAIARNDDAAANALVGLYERQTADEQSTKATRQKNGMGFSAIDAAFLSSLAEQVIANKQARKDGTLRQGYGLLSKRQLEIVRERLPHYVRQLVEIAEEKMARRGQETAPQASGEDDTARYVRFAEFASRQSAEDQALIGWALQKAQEKGRNDAQQTAPSGEPDIALTRTETIRVMHEMETEPNPLANLPSALVEIPGGWRWKTAKEFAHEAHSKHGHTEGLVRAMRMPLDGFEESIGAREDGLPDAEYMEALTASLAE